MADPLSVSASIAGIISLADIVFRYVFRYTRAAAGAKDEIKALSTEIHDLGGVLRNLDALCRTLEAEPDQAFNPGLQPRCLSQIQDTFGKIEKRVKKSTEAFDRRGKLKELSEKLKWPFSSSETKDLLAKISRYKETLILAASVDTIRELQLCLAKQSEQGQKLDDLNHKLDTIQACIEIPTKIKLDERKRHILDFFLKPETNPQINLDQSIKLRHPTTGGWLFNDQVYQQWLDHPGSRLWLNGLAGGGKTILAGAVIQDALSVSSDEIGVAFFFCDYKNEATLTPVNILGGLASQLARQRNEFFDNLREYYEELHPARGLDKLADADELRARLCSMAEGLKNLIVIIDGIDECGNSTSDVLEILVELADAAENVTVALFSRDELSIRDLLESFEEIRIEAHTEDLQDYVRAELEQRTYSGRLSLKNMDLKIEIGEELVRRANGMFRWVVCQLDYLCEFSTDDDRREALKELPPTLRETYTRLLVRINARPPKVRRMVQMCLHFIAFFPWELSIRELCQAVSTLEVTGISLSESRMVSERDISRECSSLIRISANDQNFEFAHFTVQEFLQDSSLLQAPGLEDFYMNKVKSNLIMATQCVRFLQMKNFDKQPSITEEWPKYKSDRAICYPFYDKASIAWPILSREGLDNNELLDAVKSLFHPFKISFFFPWAENFIDYARRGMHLRMAAWEQLPTRFLLATADIYSSVEIIKGGIKPLHISAVLNIPEITDFLLSVEGKGMANAKSTLGTPLYLAETSILGLPTKLQYRGLSKSHVQFCSIGRRRMATIACLSEAGADLAGVLGTPGVFSKASILDFHLKSFDSSIHLLKAGLIPDDREIGIFTDALSLKNFNQEDQELESSFLGFLSYLKNSGIYKSEWGFALGKCIWSVSLEMNFSFTKNPELTDTRISLSDESLKARILAAIRIDDVEQLQISLEDPRVSVNDDGKGGTFLHNAVLSEALQCTRLLLELGSDPSSKNTAGQSPVHLCNGAESTEILKILVEHNADMFIQDDEGWNLWHYYSLSAFHVSVLDGLFKIDMERGHKSLLVEEHDGYTPLDLCFEEALAEEDIILFIEYCNQMPMFWEAHRCVFPLAAKNGYKGVLEKLLELNVVPKTIETDKITPLHDLGPEPDLEIVRMLKALYPTACQLRIEGHTPLEHYLNNIRCGPKCVSESVSFVPDKDIIHALYCKPDLGSNDGSRAELWQYTCQLITQVIVDWGRCPLHKKKTHDQVIGNSVVEVMIELGAMQDYETEVALSSVELFFEAVSAAIRKGPHLMISEVISTNTIEKAILSSQFWEPNSQWAIKLMYNAVRCVDLSTVRYLLSTGLDVHQRLEDATIIEKVCWGVWASRLCKEDDGKAVIQCLLEHSNPEKLKDLDIYGSSLLHRFGTPSNELELQWLVQTLVEKGLDVNVLNSARVPALLTHITQRSFFSASSLLELGADPNLTFPPPKNWNAIMAAACNDGISILSTILASSEKSNAKIDWEALTSIEYSVGTEEWTEDGCTAIHGACRYGNLDCVKFFIQHKLLNVESLTYFGMTPLHFCANQGHPDVIEYLVEVGARVNTKDGYGETPLHCAAREGQLKSVKLLVELGATDERNKQFKSPTMLAADFDHQEVVQFLERAFNEKLHPEYQISAADQNQNKVLLGKLFAAIENNSLESCRLLVAAKCPLNVTYNKLTPFQYSLIKKQPQIAQLFLEHGSSVLGELWTNEYSQYEHQIDAYTTLGYAFSHEMFDSLLPDILSRFLEDGGCFLQQTSALGPVPSAMKARNVQGIRTFLEFLTGNLEQISQRSQVESQEVIPSILNMACQYSGHMVTPLHIATGLDLIDAMRLLLESGANPDVVDLSGTSPLDQVRSSTAAQVLIEWDASVTQCMALPYMNSVSSSLGTIVQLRNIPGTTTKSFLAALAYVLRRSVSLQPFHRQTMYGTTLQFSQTLELLGASRGESKLGGTSLINALYGGDRWQSYFLNSPHLLDQLEPFNWHETMAWFRPPFLLQFFRHYSRRLLREDFQKWANLQPERGWSPLCRAAARGDLVVIENCLSLGADIDFEGCPLGSALILASTCGRLESVELLVKHGGAISYTGREGAMSALSVARSKAVRRFLLTGQFQKAKFIGDADIDNDCSNDRRQFWSGIAQARLRLAAPFYGRRQESSLEYARYLNNLRVEMRGKVASFIDGVQYSNSDGTIAIIKNAGPKVNWQGKSSLTRS